MLRKHNVVEKFVEFFGSGMKNLTVPNRATIANMSPEYGATMGFFPVDEKTVDYLKMTNRQDQAELVETCTKALGLFYTGQDEPEYTEVLELDLSTIEPSVSGPARPQDRIAVKHLKEHFYKILGCEYDRNTQISHISTFQDESGCQTSRPTICQPHDQKMYGINLNGNEVKIGDGSVVIAAITSCTNTSNPIRITWCRPFGQERRLKWGSRSPGM